MKNLSNQDIAHVLEEMALLYEMQNVAFKPRAYEKAAYGVLSLTSEARLLYEKGGMPALEGIPGVGKGIAAHIADLLETGKMKEYERLKKKVPVDVVELTAVEGIGPQTTKTLWEKLKIKNLAGLEKAAKTGKIRALEGFGEKTEEKILKGIEFLKASGGRHVLGIILPELKALEEKIGGWSEVKKVSLAGSVRRFKETIGDVDILAISSAPEKTMKQFVSLPDVAHVYGSGESKTNVHLKNGLDADLRIVPADSWGTALNYFTGSKAHNIALRKRAIKKGWKLSEYGLFDKRGKQIAGKTEEDLYKKLGLAYIPPELREMTGEIEAAEKGKLPKLVEYKDLRGDLQIQTTWTDGANTIEEMAEAAMEQGLEYIAITDHTKALAMTGGADEKQLERQIKAIEKVNEKLKRTKKKFHVLTGAEVNIMKDGSLDIADETLAKLDVVGAAVHSHFALKKAEQTKRIIRAMENPHVDIIFHLTARVINRRPTIELDVEQIIDTAKKTGTVLEIDCYPDRSDIKDDYIRMCVKKGVKMAIDTDAHSIKHLVYLEYGARLARRGWAKKTDILNTLPVDKMLAKLKDGK